MKLSEAEYRIVKCIAKINLNHWSGCDYIDVAEELDYSFDYTKNIIEKLFKRGAIVRDGKALYISGMDYQYISDFSKDWDRSEKDYFLELDKILKEK